jgi:hypothetical protein
VIGKTQIIHATVAELQDVFARWPGHSKEDVATFLELLGVLPTTNDEPEDWMMKRRRMNNDA